MIKRILLFCITIQLLIPSSLIGQIIGFDKIDDSKVTSWNPKLTVEYQYVYRFGDSEMESDFILIFGLDKYYGQIKSGAFSNDGKAWIWTYENLTYFLY